MRYRAICLAALALLLSACATPPAGNVQAMADALNDEGLETVPSRNIDIVQVRPGADFSTYRGVLLREPELDYRTPDRAQQQFALSQEQKDGFQDYIAEIFASELGQMASPVLVDATGPDVLELQVRLTDITATVPPRSAGPAGRVSIALRAVGDVTLVLEFSDSESGELLARAIDQKAIEGVAIAKEGELVTRWEDVEAIVKRWARLTRQGLEEALSAR
jgi:hypothetical protein